MNEQYVSPYHITNKFDINSNTLRTWANEGKIRCIRTNQGKGKRLYHYEDIKTIFGIEPTTILKQKICYARVSSDHQKEDLVRQIDLLKQKYPSYEIISDIGSGLNWKRKGFMSILERVHNNEIEEVVVAYKDRLCRFGFEIIEWLFEKTNTKIVVLNNFENKHEDLNRELADDLLSITTVFVARNNGIRSGINRKERQRLKEINETTTETIETTVETTS